MNRGTAPQGRTPLAIVAALSLFSLSACIDDFPVALDSEPKLKLDQRLIGTWVCLGAEPEVPSDLKLKSGADEGAPILKFESSGQWYHIRTVGFDKPDVEWPWDAYPSKLGNRTVLNAWDVANTPRSPGTKLALFTYKWLSPDLFQLDLVDPDPLKGQALAPSSALRKTLQSHWSDREVFRPWLFCARAKIVDPPS